MGKFGCPCARALCGVAPSMLYSHNLSEHAATINQAVEQLIANLKVAASEGRQVDILQQLGQMTLQVTGAAAFG